MFTAQAIIRDIEKSGHKEEIEQISGNISKVAPELPGKSAKDQRDWRESWSNNGSSPNNAGNFLLAHIG